MAVYDLPAALRPATWEFGLQRAGTQFRSPYTASVQAVDWAADHWIASLVLPPRLPAQAGQAEAFFARLAGGVNRVRLWHQTRPVPMGTARGSPLLAETAPRGASTLSIGRAAAAPNLVPNGGFEIDSNNDGIADYWDLYDGTGAGVLSLVPGRSGANAQRYTTTSPTLTHQKGIRLIDGSSGLVWLPGQSYVVSWYARAPISSGMLGLNTTLQWNVSLTMSQLAGAGLTTSWQRFAYAIQWGASVEQDGRLFVAVSPGTEVGAWEIDDLQVELGTSLSEVASRATLKAGDMLGAGGQLFMVADDVTLNDAGAGTVNVVNRARAAIGGGSAVTWLRPTAEFMLPAPAARFAHQQGVLAPLSLDLEEYVG